MIPRRFTYSRAVRKKLAEWIAGLEAEISEMPLGDYDLRNVRQKNLDSWRRKLTEYDRGAS